METVKTNWNTELYLRFGDERDKPIRDLIFHIPVKNPKRIIDIGCGPGNSTVPFKKLYPGAEITGIDNSPGMIEKAKTIDKDISWVLKDANNDLSDLGKFDIVFSNSALHWLPGHDKILPRFFNLLTKNGAIAVQVPYFFGTPIYGPLYSLVKNEKWNKHIPVKEPVTYNDTGFYYDILSSHFTVFDIWTTKHTHVLDSKEDIMNWYRPTGFKSFLDQLGTEELRNDFLADLIPIIDELYKPQKNGKYLLRFERLFFVAERN